MRYLKFFNATYSFIFGLGAGMMVLRGEIFKGGLVGLVGNLLGLAVFVPPFILAFYAIKERTPERIKKAFWSNALLLAALVLFDALIFSTDPNSVESPIGLLLVQGFFFALPAALNLRAMKSLRSSQTSPDAPHL